MVMIYQISNDDYRIRIHKIVAATSEATNARNEIFYFTENKKKTDVFLFIDTILLDTVNRNTEINHYVIWHHCK